MLKDERIDFDPETGKVSHPPRQVFLELTGRCNLACVHCSKDYGLPEAKDERHMPINLVDKLQPWIEGAQFLNLNLVGEPMMAPAYRDVIQRARKGNAEVSFNTNALLMNEEEARFLIENEVNSIAISFDGMEFNQRVRGMPYESVLKKVQLFDRVKKEMGAKLPHLAIAYTLFRDNVHELLPLLEMILPDIDVHAVHVQPLVVFYETLKDQNVYDAPSVDEVIEKARAMCKQHGVELVLFRSQFVQDEREAGKAKELMRELGPHSDKFGCSDPFFEVKVRADGGLLACSFGIESPLNLLDHSLEEVWNGEFYCELRKRLYAKRFEGKCENCPCMFGSYENNLSPMRPGVHHSKAKRFLGEESKPVSK